MEGPPMPMPPGGDVIQSTRYMVGIIVLTVVSVLIVWLRMYVRVFVSRNVGWDDYTMFAASLISVVTNAFLILSYHFGVGRHIVYVPPENIPPTFMWLWAGEPTNLFAVYLVRLSICLFFIRLIPPKKIYYWVIWITIALLTVSDVFTSIYYFFECRPIRKVWEPEIPGKCFSVVVQKWATWLYQATSVLGDLVLLTIPVTLFWRLQVPLQTKIGLIVICSLGIFTNVCAIVKTILLPNLFSANLDKTWIVKDLAFWAPMELTIGMICGTIPALAPLFGLTTKSPSYRRRKYRKCGDGGGFGESYELSNSNNSGKKSSQPSARHQGTMNSVAGHDNLGRGVAGYDGMMEKPSRAVTVTRPDSRENFWSDDTRKDENGIRTTYEVEVNSESVDGLVETIPDISHRRDGGAAGGNVDRGGRKPEQKAYRWNVV